MRWNACCREATRISRLTGLQHVNWQVNAFAFTDPNPINAGSPAWKVERETSQVERVNGERGTARCVYRQH